MSPKLKSPRTLTEGGGVAFMHTFDLLKLTSQKNRFLTNSRTLPKFPDVSASFPSEHSFSSVPVKHVLKV